jgi:Resolvase, N terminal domain
MPLGPDDRLRLTIRHGRAIRKLRCGVYTCKSTEEGIDMEFNSLDAQREACEAYVASQRAEGWLLVRDRYDDGGFSSGNLERPALKRLLGDIEAGRVCRRDLQDRPPVTVADGLLPVGGSIRPPQRHLRLGYPVLQYHAINGGD